MSRTNQNLSPAAAATLRSIAAAHDIRAVSGPHAGEGSSTALVAAIVAGDVQTVRLDPGELAAVVPWLKAQAAQIDPESALGQALLGLMYDLRAALPPAHTPGAAPSEGPINTLEG